MANELCYGECIDSFTSHASHTNGQNQLKQKRNMLQELPAEIQTQIIGHLGYLDGIRLSRVNNYYYYSSIDRAWWTEEVAAKEIRDVEQWEKHNRISCPNQVHRRSDRKLTVLSDGYACYGCFRVLDKGSFSRNQTERRGAKSSKSHMHRGYRRLCIGCSLANGRYQAGGYLNIVTKQSLEIEYGVMRQVEAEVKKLRVCQHCGDACEFTSVSNPQICNECETVQIQIDDSDEAIAAIKMLPKGYEIIECLGCHGRTEIEVGCKTLQCAGCDQSICKSCSAVREWGCDCNEPQEQPVQKDDWLMLDRLFDPSRSPRKTGGDLLSDDVDG